MMRAADLARRVGNKLYEAAFPVYRPLYSAWKAHEDRAERRLVAGVLSPGSIVVDAGANIGVYSRFLSKCVGSEGMVHSFEPSPDNFARLQAAVAHLPNVRANQLAVGDRTGEQLLYVSGVLNVDHRTYPVERESRSTLSVSSIRLDDYFKLKQRVDFIKLDIQGYELHALRGANRVLVENPELKILLEFWPHGLRGASVSPETLLLFLKNNGFRIYGLTGDDLKEFAGPAAYAADHRDFFNIYAER